MKTTNTPPAHRQGEDGDRRAEDERRVETEESEAEALRKILATNITEQRKRLKLSRAALADKVGVTEAAIGQYERGIRTPQIEILCKFADLFNVSVDELVGHSSENYNAVEQYRFEKAVDLVSDFGFFVFETKLGGVKICSQEDKHQLPLFQVEDGVVSAGQTKERFHTHIEFSDRKSFISFIEHFPFFFLINHETVDIFSSYMAFTARGDEFFPDLLIKNCRNIPTDPYNEI